MLADEVVTPRAELLKILTSVLKFDPFAPCAEPTTARNTSLLAASGAIRLPFVKIAPFSPRLNEHGLARICCASEAGICVDPTIRLLTTVTLLSVSRGVMPPACNSCSEVIVPLPSPFRKMS